VFHRLLKAEQDQPELYEKAKGSAGIHGQVFEYKFCALEYLRATNKGYRFKLASNVKGLGAFDDVTIEYLDDNSRKSHIFVQLKSKVKRHVTISQLKSKNGDFSLRKYYESYLQVEENFNCSEGVKMDGSIEESLFIIYTNTDVACYLKSNRVTDIGEEEFLMTGGSVLQFNEEEHKAIYEHLQDLPKHRKFLSRLRILYRQADEKEMDTHIKSELQQSLKAPESELGLACMCFVDFMKEWWQNSNYFLKETNSKENDPLRKTSEKVRTAFVSKILDQRKSELDDLSIKYKESAITNIQQLIEPHKAVLIFAPGRSTTLTAAKIHKMFSNTAHVILNVQQLVRYKTEVMLAWKQHFNIIILEGDSSAEDFQDTAREIYMTLNKSGAEKQFIFIANTMGNRQHIRALRRTFREELTEEYDDWKFTDIIPESRTILLEKKVTFQGVEIPIKSIVKESDVRMLNALDCDSISLLLANEKPSIGTPTDNTLKYYINRNLECRKYIKHGTQNGSEVLTPFRGGILKELQFISTYRQKNCNIIDYEQENPHLSLANENKKETITVCNEADKLQCLYKEDEEQPWEQKSDFLVSGQRNFQRKATTVWRPTTLLDCDDRIILLTDEPGMGKSTLMSHLAKETKERHPHVWVVRVNINNYSAILQEIKTNGFDENGALKLLTEAAQIKETEGMQLEKKLFNYIYNSTGNMAVLIDGVDEVCPH